MVRKAFFFGLVLYLGFGLSVKSQMINIGVGLNASSPNMKTEDIVHYTSYVYNPYPSIWYGQTQDLKLQLIDVSSVPLPVGWLSFESKNRLLVSVGITSSRNIYHYDIDQSMDLGIRQITTDVIGTIGYKINPFGIVHIIPEAGITNRTLIGAKTGITTGNGNFDANQTINDIPQITGVMAGYLSNQAMDFKPNVVYARAGIRIKWYNFYLQLGMEQNITGLDNRNQYQSANHFYWGIGVDALSTFLIKKQRVR